LELKNIIVLSDDPLTLKSSTKASILGLCLSSYPALFWAVYYSYLIPVRFSFALGNSILIVLDGTSDFINDITSSAYVAEKNIF